MTGYEFMQYLMDTFGAIVLAAALTVFLGYKILEKFVYSKFDERATKLEQKLQKELLDINSFHAISKFSLEKAFQKRLRSIKACSKKLTAEQNL